MTDNNEPSSSKLAFGDFAPTLVELTDNVLFGQVWERTAELSAKDRSLITVAVLATLGAEVPLKFHLDLARQNGNTEAELVEAITHIAFYAGWPRGMVAMTVAKQLFDSPPA